MDVDFEARNYLYQLDSIKKPPETVKSLDTADHDYPASSKLRQIPPDFRQKLHELNISHQKKIYESTRPIANPVSNKSTLNGSSLPPTSGNNKTMLKLGEYQQPTAQISKDEIEKLRKSVLQATRPKNPWADRQSPSSLNGQDHKDEPKKPIRSPLNVQTVSGEDILFDARRAQLSVHSMSPVSPLSNSTPSSSSSTNGTTKWQTPIKLDSPTETFHAKPAVAASNRKIGNGTTSYGYSQPVKVKTYYHGGITEPVQSSENGHSRYQVPNARPKTNGPSYQPSKQASNFLKPDAKNTKVPSWRQPKIQVSPIHEVIRSEPKVSPTTSDMKILEELEVESRKRMEVLKLDKELSRPSSTYSSSSVEKEQKRPSPTYSSVEKCGRCLEPVLDNNKVAYAMEKMYHDKCFTCDICYAPLKGTRFYRINEKNYCEDDYLRYSIQESKPKCVKCHESIFETVLQALGKAYHPQCFRCHKCRRCLDGIPFAADAQGLVYCMDDYQDTLSPMCASCDRPIKAANDFGQIVRVVALDKEYHIDCYICEGCGTQLTNEKERQCYPLDGHLLCKNCHIHWKKYGGMGQPITDL